MIVAGLGLVVAGWAYGVSRVWTWLGRKDRQAEADFNARFATYK